MDRVQQNQAVTIYADFVRDGVAEDPSPDSAVVEITRASTGATVYSGAAIDVDDPAGRFGYTLTPADTSLLDTLYADWTVTYDSVEQTARTVIEVVGGFLFSVGEARAIEPFSKTNNDSTYRISTAQILQVRTLVEEALEDACDRAFVPRYREETVDGSGSKTLLLSKPDLRTIRTVDSDSTAYTVDQIAGLALRPSGVVFDSLSSWARGTANVTVGYEYGKPFPPARVKRAALLLAKRWITSGPGDDRATTMTTDDQTTTFYIPERNEPFDVPEANAVVREYGLRVGIA